MSPWGAMYDGDTTQHDNMDDEELHRLLNEEEVDK